MKNKRKNTNNKIKLIISCCVTAVCMLSVVLGIALAPKPVHDKPQLFEAETEYVNGIDISHHNGAVDWEVVAENYDFAILRVGFRGYSAGNIAEDEMFKENIRAANEAGIPVGIYFYSQATTPHEAKQEAEFALSKIAGHKVDLPVFIDYEYAFDEDGMHAGRLFDAKLTAKQAAAVINAFCEKINKGGHYAGVYASSYVMNNEIKMSDLHKNLYIWVADYNSAVTYKGKYDLWQFSKTGEVAGAQSKYTDLNRWYIK